MKTSFFLMTFLFICSLAYGAPKVKVTPTKHDFGNVLPGEKCLMKITILNEGDQSLNILAVEPQCGCTTVDSSQKKLEPGFSTDINITMVANPSDGKMTKTVKITTDDPANSEVVVTLTAIVVSDYQLSQTKFNFGYLYPGDTKQLSFTLTPKGDLPVQIQDVKYNSTAIKLEYKKVTPDNPLSAYVFDLVYNTQENRPARRAYEKIKIYPYGGENKDKFLDVEITGWVKPNIIITPSNSKTPSQNVFKLVEKGATSEEIVTIKHRLDKPFNITHVESDNPLIVPVIQKIENKTPAILVKLLPGSTKKSESTLIKFKTDLSEAPQMSFNISFTFKR